MLNEAYKVLMREDLRLKYNASIGQVRRPFNKDKSCLGYSTWNGPLRSQALFVDGNACIGHNSEPKFVNSSLFLYLPFFAYALSKFLLFLTNPRQGVENVCITQVTRSLWTMLSDLHGLKFNMEMMTKRSRQNNTIYHVKFIIFFHIMVNRINPCET